MTSTSTAVKEQYETYPYPRRDPENERHTLISTSLDCLDRINYYCFGGKKDFSKAFRVLIAGAGTGDALIFLAEQLRDTQAEIVYLDISEASMEVAKKRAEVRGLNNITWKLDSLLALPELGLGIFDYINCSGVLHHLEQPEQGLRALASALKEDGAMGLMLYAKYGRTGVYQMQELMRLINAGTTSMQEKVDNTKTVLGQLPKQNWFQMTRAAYQTDIEKYGDIGIYDLLLHAQDRAYSVPELHEFISSAGLVLNDFIGSDLTANTALYNPAFYLQDETLLAKIRKLDKPAQQAIAELLNGQIKKHTFYVSKQRQEPPSLQDWEYVPELAMGFVPEMHASLCQAAKEAEDQIPVITSIQDRKIGVYITKTPHAELLFTFWNGKRTLKAIFEKVLSACHDKGESVTHEALTAEFSVIFRALRLYDWVFLRHKSVPPVKALSEMLPKGPSGL